MAVAYLTQYSCVFKDTLPLERQIIAISRELGGAVCVKQLVSRQWNYRTLCTKICIILRSDEVRSGNFNNLFKAQGVIVRTMCLNTK